MTQAKLLVCPQCKGPLEKQLSSNRMVCQKEQVAYPIIHDIPVLIPNQAIALEDK